MKSLFKMLPPLPLFSDGIIGVYSLSLGMLFGLPYLTHLLSGTSQPKPFTLCPTAEMFSERISISHCGKPSGFFMSASTLLNAHNLQKPVILRQNITEIINRSL